jgi:hypothetical protein
VKVRKIAFGLLALLAVAGIAGWFSLDQETRLAGDAEGAARPGADPAR